MQPSLRIEAAFNALVSRRLPDGGFCELPKGDYRPDTTAWAILCLDSGHRHPQTIKAARTRLCASQHADGSLSLAPDYPEVLWPTAVASLALAKTREFSVNHAKTVESLLASSGEPLPREPDSPFGHDLSIQGWSWTTGTHSWVEPTALAVRALSLAGKSDHDRVRSGIKLLLDRQLPSGGWNYGNTTVYGKTLHAMPTPSGMALWALAGLIAPEQVATSLCLLQEQLSRLRTPVSLGWVLLGLAAWDVAPPKTDVLIEACLQQQTRHGDYGTTPLCVLLTAASSLETTGSSHV